MRNLWAWALLALCFAGSSAAGQTLNVDGVALNIPALPGYCVTRDEGLLNDLRQTLGGAERRLLAVSATCEDIAKFNAGQVLEGWRSIIWGVRTTERGTAFLLPPGLTRRDFADTRANALQKLDMSALISDINKRLSSQSLGFRLTKVGLIARDPDAVYEVGLIDDGAKVMASIVGSTEIRGLQMAIAGADKLNDSGALSALLSLVQRATRAAVADNPD